MQHRYDSPSTARHDNPRDAVREHHLRQVGIGQVCVGAHSDQLHALLGSCIGIAFIWKKGERCALAHCLLPEAPENMSVAEAVRTVSACAGRYVSIAVPLMLKLMGAREADCRDIDVIVAGGASMFHSSHFKIGQRNAEAAQKYLAQSGLRVRHCALGGNAGREITIDCEQHSFAINDIVTPPLGSTRLEPAYGHA